MYQLQGFPTHSVLKDFTPYRGIILSSQIQIKSDDRTSMLFPEIFVNSRVQIDTTPILSRIAKEWNYDLALLQEGDGYTGVEDHSWTVYADDKSTPQIIRWKQGIAQIIIAIGARFEQMQLIAIGNEAAIAILDKLNQLFSDITSPITENLEITTEVDNQLVKTLVQARSSVSSFNTDCVIYVPENGKLSPSQFKYYVGLLNSSNLRLQKSPNRSSGDNGELNSHLMIKIPELRIKALYDQQKELSEDMLRVIYNEGIIRCQGFMTYLFSECLVPNYGTNDYLTNGEFTFEDFERVRWLDVQSKLLVDSPYTEQAQFWTHVSVSTDFANAGTATIRGTGSDMKKRKTGGDNLLRQDLLGHLVQSLISLSPDLIGEQKTKGEDSGFTIQGTIKLDDKSAFLHIHMEQRKAEMIQMKIQPLAKPHFSVHLGMPVRVDRSIVVWREIDNQALVCDIWYDLDSRHLHVAKLYRSPIPTS